MQAGTGRLVHPGRRARHRHAARGRHRARREHDLPRRVDAADPVVRLLAQQRAQDRLPAADGRDPEQRSASRSCTPFYWNIAPNYDATIAPRYMAQRGLQFLNQFRFLTPYARGEARYEILPEDKKLNNETRYATALVGNYNFLNGFTGLVNYQKVSDDNYFRDLSGRLSIATQTLSSAAAARDLRRAVRVLERDGELPALPDAAGPAEPGPDPVLPRAAVPAERAAAHAGRARHRLPRRVREFRERRAACRPAAARRPTLGCRGRS